MLPGRWRERGHSGPAPRPSCRGDCSHCPGNLSTRGCVMFVSARLNIFFPRSRISRFTFETFTQISGPNQLKWSWWYKASSVCSVCCCCMMVVGGQQAAGHWAVIMERCNFRRVIIITAGCPRYSCKRTFARFELLRLMKVPTSASTINNLLEC